jgi:phosphocarrier protein
MTAIATAALRDPLGLHARPSVALVKLAKSFEAAVEVAAGDANAGAAATWVPAKSLMKVMKVKAPNGTVLSFRADGPDAEAAVAALARLVEENFPGDADA